MSQLSSVLQIKFREMQARNQKFSLRAFARRLRMSPSAISEMLKGRRNISKKALPGIGDVLNLNSEEFQAIEDEISGREWVSPGRGTFAKSTRRIIGTKNLDELDIVSDWVNFALMVLLETQDAKSEPKWLAARLGVTLKRVEKSIRMLIKYGLLERLAGGELRSLNNEIATPDEVRSKALLARHLKNLKDASKAVQRAPRDRRDFTFATVALDPKKLPLLFQMIREFENRLLEFSDSHPKKEVFEFCVQLFPRTGPK